MTTIVTVILVVIVIAILWVIGAFNSLVTLKNRAKEALSDIDVQTKRRYDLIPNLVETVKGYAIHESQLFDRVTKARTAAMSATGLSGKAEAENALSGTLKSLFAVAENYPDLKASTNFLALQNELTDTEDKIQAARRFYNTNVRDLNIKVESFPANIIAKSFGFAEMELFQTAEAEKQPVSVKF
ncbi:MAG: LemA family protein [Candidatus Staskawiczbacteria bacterium]|nr:LemA family protein [Candidatus Staskawiczbacteria bacterium]